MGRIPGDLAHPEGMQVLGVPACALYYKTTFLDLVLPRLLAGRELTRAELARIGEGGYCLGCKICTYPNVLLANSVTRRHGEDIIRMLRQRRWGDLFGGEWTVM